MRKRNTEHLQIYSQSRAGLGMIEAMSSAARHTADRHDTIRVRGARENNLKGITLEIPKR